MTDRIHCDEVRDKMPLYVGADLDDDGLQRVERHLQGCSSCRVHADRASRGRSALVDAYAGQMEEAKSPELWAGLQAALHKEGLVGPRFENEAPWADEIQPPAPLPGLRLLRRAAPLAAAAACVLFIWGVFGTDSSMGPPSGGPQPGTDQPFGGPFGGEVAGADPGRATVLPLRRVEAGEPVLLETIERRRGPVGRGVRPLGAAGSPNQLAGYSGGELGKLR